MEQVNTPMARKGLIQLWVRGDKEFGKRVNSKAESLGYMTADYLRKVIDYGLDNPDPLFFARGDDLKTQLTTNEPE